MAIRYTDEVSNLYYLEMYLINLVPSSSLFFFFSFFVGTHMVVLRAYSSFLFRVLWLEPGLAVYKTHFFPALVSPVLFSLSHGCVNIRPMSPPSPFCAIRGQYFCMERKAYSLSSYSVLQEDQAAAHLGEVLWRDPAPSVEATHWARGTPASILAKGEPHLMLLRWRVMSTLQRQQDIVSSHP